MGPVAWQETDEEVESALNADQLTRWPNTQRSNLLDTNILVHYIRDNALARGSRPPTRSAFKRRVRSSVVSPRAEIESLALQLNWPAEVPSTARSARTLHFGAVRLAGVIEAYARISTHTRNAGVPMVDNDLWIAATPRRHAERAY